MYSLIIPVYKNKDSIPELLSALDAINQELHNLLEVVFVVDGSPDNSEYYLQSLLPSQSFKSQLLVLSRNFGSFSAIRAGLQQASGPYFSVMAADLQEPPELIISFFNTLSANTADIVMGTREGRDDPWSSRLFSNIFWNLYRKLVLPEIPVGGIDMFGCNQIVRDCLLACNESNTSLVGLLFWAGFRRQFVPYVRRKRVHGCSSWTFKKKFNYLMDSIFAFTDLPIKLLLSIGSLGLSISFLFGFIILGVRLFGNMPIPGYAATVLMVLFFGGLNVFGLGIIGSYAWRGYENSKCRPLAVIAHKTQFNTLEKS